MKLANIKPSKFKTLILPLTAITAGSFWVSLKLFDIAFKRVDYVPETSKEKQQYADLYYQYVDWFHQMPSEEWYLNRNDPDKRMVATYIPAEGISKKTVIIAHGYKGNRETMANYAKMFHLAGWIVWIT